MATEQEVFEYLDDLRETGVTNMYGSPAYLETQLGISHPDALEFVKKWMDTFSERHPA